MKSRETKEISVPSGNVDSYGCQLKKKCDAPGVLLDVDDINISH